MKFLLIYLLLVMTMTDPAISTKILAPHSPTHRRFSREPKVFLANYGILYEIQPEGDAYDSRFRTQYVFENEFVSKNGSDYILFRGLTDVVFACRARYPVKWTVPFPKQVQHLNSYELHTTDLRSSTFTPEDLRPHNKFFESQLSLSLPGVPFLSVSANFTCESVDTQHIHKTSIYIYKRGSDFEIENQGATIQLSVDYKAASKDEDFILPCRPSSPRFTVILEKETLNKTFTEIVGRPHYLSFDPKVGFTMSKGLLGNKLFGLYRCRLDKNKGENENEILEDGELALVYINITMRTPDVIAPEEFKTMYLNKGNATVLFDSDSIMLCCSGEAGKRPETLTQFCNEASQCEIAKQIIMEKSTNLKEFGSTEIYHGHERDDCSGIFMAIYWTSTVVYCKGGGLTYQQHHVYAFESNIQNLEKRLETTTTREKYFMKYVMADTLPNLPLDQKVFISVGRSVPYNYYYDNYGEESFHLFERESWQLLGNSHPVAMLQSVRIREYDRNHYFEGEKLIISCFSLPLLYSVGSQFKITWKNGTATILPTVNYESVSMYFAGNVFFSQGRGVTVNHCFSKEIEAHLDMDSVECFVPRWNTSDWEVLKYELDVRPAVLPEVEVEEESVNLNLFDQDAEIIFKINGGQPPPKDINVFKDNKLIEGVKIVRKWDSEIGFQTQIVSEGGQGPDSTLKLNVSIKLDTPEGGNNSSDSRSLYSVHIMFPNVSHDFQGIYSVTAENIKGNGTGSIQIYVTGRGHTATATLLIGFILTLGLLAVAIGIWYKYQHKVVQTLRFGIRRL